MRRFHAADLLLWPVALAVLLAVDVVWPGLRAVGRWRPLARLRSRVAALPPGVALPLFLVPEVCSRLGWVLSTWLLVLGRPWPALALYLGTKLVAGGLALWVYLACEPALLRVRWFAAGH